MKLELIRDSFIKFFEQRGHVHVNPATIVNREDPTLMFTNAGMNQFKHYFTNPNAAPNKRLVNIQPCLRVSGKHNDIEDVGIDTYHHTMFEMMGTWSFGDYFKKDAIMWAWELITDVYKIEKDRLYISIFGGDKAEGLEKDIETYNLWKQYVSGDHILDNCTKKDNFWEMGDIGPCGPCTEIHVDIRSNDERSKVPGRSLVNTDNPQVIEIWNLVFIQYERLVSGKLIPLTAKHIDTGMGLERLAMVLQAKKSNYDTDVFAPLLAFVSKQYGHPYGFNNQTDMAMRVIVDHVRAIAFSIADGQSPSNNKAGYVIRRILRRSVRYGYTYLGFNRPFMYQVVYVLAEQLKDIHPHIYMQKDHIARIVLSEEEAFLRTLSIGINKLDRIVAGVAEGSAIINGQQAFEMYDTYGFPIDLTLLIAREKGLNIDMQKFEECLAEQQKRSKNDAKVEYGDWIKISNSIDNTLFVGYDTLKANVYIVQYRSFIRHGEQFYQIVLDQTPFYAQGGGQVGDIGKLICNSETIQVLNTYKENDIIVHEVINLPSNTKAQMIASVDEESRENISNNHTATHLLNGALRKIFGVNVEQRGSFVNDKILRFDFSHNSKIELYQISEIERLVNQKIRQNIPLEDLREIPIQEAKLLGACALFGEKYGDRVRVVSFDRKYSTEFCGGTHAKHTGNLGLFKILSNCSIAAGVRRIEATTGLEAETFIEEQIMDLNSVKQKFKNPLKAQGAIESLLLEFASLKKKLSYYEDFFSENIAQDISKNFIKKDNVNVLITQLDVSSVQELDTIVAKIKSKYPMDLYIVLLAKVENNTYIKVWVSKEACTTWGISAKNIVSELAKVINGKGGGNETMATAIGPITTDVAKVLNLANSLCK
jgi:alanyl-tRNA synthetase